MILPFFWSSVHNIVLIILIIFSIYQGWCCHDFVLDHLISYSVFPSFATAFNSFICLIAAAKYGCKFFEYFAFSLYICVICNADFYFMPQTADIIHMLLEFPFAPHHMQTSAKRCSFIWLWVCLFGSSVCIIDKQ